AANLPSLGTALQEAPAATLAANLPSLGTALEALSFFTDLRDQVLVALDSLDSLGGLASAKAIAAALDPLPEVTASAEGTDVFIRFEAFDHFDLASRPFDL